MMQPAMKKAPARRAKETHPTWMRLLLDLPFVGVAICDATDHRWTHINDRFCAMVGYDAGELARMNWHDLCHPGDRADGDAAFKRLLARRSLHVRSALRLIRKDGSVSHTEIDLSFKRALSGSEEYVVALVSDAATRQTPAAEANGRAKIERAEAARRDAEEKLHAVVEQSITGNYIIEDGRFSFVNPRMAEIFGYANGELTGVAALEVVAPEDRDLAAENIRKRLAGEINSLQFEFRGRRKDGALIEVGAHGSLAVIRGKRMIIGVLQDITERSKDERRIKEYVRKLETAMLATVDTISRMVDLRDPYTAGHEKRVAHISAAIARRLGLDGERIKGLEIAGRVHDIGKIGVPSEILSKPVRLSTAEFELVKQHAAHGFGILNGIEFPWPVAEVAHQHHERMDGSGYPRGLKGAEIIHEARILAVADVIEAMSSHRPYRASLGIEPALAEIERGAGQIYDPDVSTAALQLFRDQGYAIPV
jgi:PAS domain S-box-containing protein